MTAPSVHTFIIEKQHHGIRLDKVLAHKLHPTSRSHLQALIEQGYVKVDHNSLTEITFKVKEGQEIEVTIPPLMETSPSPQEIPLLIVYEDKDVLVINKPSGMVVHPAPGAQNGTLVNALLNHCGGALSSINGVKRPGIVHRLDKETSGLLVVAKHDKAHHHLAHQLATREMGRRYMAIVWGTLLPVEGTIEGAIGRDPHHRQRMAVRQIGKFARTHYKVLKLFGRLASLVECRLETGRTHQIRVHLASKGYPLIGDALYGKTPKSLPTDLKIYLKEKWPPARHALHAQELGFIHPTTHEKILLSTDLPEDIRNLIDMLNSL